MNAEKKYAVVTGATSGIGYELAKEAARNGINLVIAARDGEELERVGSEFRSMGVDVKTLACDLMQPGAAEQLHRHVEKLGLDVEILINNAGQGHYGMFAEEDLRKQLDIIQLNVISLVTLTHLFLIDMRAKDRGRILQLGSEVSKTPMPLMAVYAATKAFVLSFTEALINELRDTNITMTLLMPGATDTDFFDKAGMEHTKVYQEEKLDTPEEVAAMAFKALMDGERRIIGPAAKKNIAMAAVLPDDKVADNLRKKMEPSDKTPQEGRQDPEHTRSREIKEKSQSRGQSPASEGGGGA